MFRFSIRELMLVTLVVAVVASWWVDRKMLAARFDKFEERIAPFEKEFNLIVLYRSDIAESIKASQEERGRQRLRDSLAPPEVFLPEPSAGDSVSPTSAPSAD